MEAGAPPPDEPGPSAECGPALATAALGAPLGLAVSAAALGTRGFGLPLPLADLALVAFVPWAAWALGRAHIPRRTPFELPLLAFVACGALSGAVAAGLDGTPFEPVEFLKSFAKLLLYAASATLVFLLARAVGPRQSARVVALAFGLGALAGLGLYAWQLSGAPLPRTLACGEHPQTCSALFYERRWQGDSSPDALDHDVFLRAQGLAAEPTRFGYLQAMALGFLLLAPETAPRAWAAALIAASALLSFSLACYGLLGGLAALWLTRGGVPPRELRALALAFALAFCALLLPAPRAALERVVVSRLVRLGAGGEDASATLRLRSSWTLALRLVAPRPLTGAGLGNFDVGVAALRDEFPERRFLTGSVQGWNVLSHVLATTGILGTLAFAWLLLAALGGRPRLLLLFLLSLFADGSLLSAPFWVLLALYASPRSEA